MTFANIAWPLVRRLLFQWIVIASSFTGGFDPDSVNRITARPNLQRNVGKRYTAMKRHFFALIAILFAGLTSIDSAQAGRDTPLEIAADRYRDVVKDFERQVFRSRYFGRSYERLADDLEDATGRLLSATRRPHDIENLYRRWYEAQVLHSRVDAEFFGRPGGQETYLLAAYWDRVACVFDELAYQFRCVGHPAGRVGKSRGFSGSPLPVSSFNRTLVPVDSRSLQVPGSRSRLYRDDIYRDTGRRQIGQAQIGAVLSRRID